MALAATLIIPAYNEEKLIGGLLKSVVGCPHVSEILCINDGSTDNTENIVKSIKGIKYIRLKKNRGKAYAIAKGIRIAKNPIVVLADADLVGVSHDTILNLITPLSKGNYDASIGYTDTRNSDAFFKSVSGQRAYFKKDLLPHLKTIEQKGYGLELYLNYLFHKKRVKIFKLANVHNVMKFDKQPYDTVIRMALIESIDIISEVLRQDDPVSYFKNAYLTSFYIGKEGKGVRNEDVFRKIKNKLILKLRSSIN